MSISLKILLIIITCIYLTLIARLIQKRKLNLSFSIFWIFAGIGLIFALILMIISPGIINKISTFLGFEIPANMVFCISIFGLFYIGLDLTWRLSKENKKNTILIQEVSILKKRIEELEKTISK